MTHSISPWQFSYVSLPHPAVMINPVLLLPSMPPVPAVSLPGDLCFRVFSSQWIDSQLKWQPVFLPNTLLSSRKSRADCCNTSVLIINTASCKQTFYEIEMIPFIKSIIKPFALLPVMAANLNFSIRRHRNKYSTLFPTRDFKHLYARDGNITIKA